MLLVVALIVIPPERLPEVMQTVGKILRELRLASNTIVRELSGALDDPRYSPERPQDNPMTSPWANSETKLNSESSTDEPPAPQ